MARGKTKLTLIEAEKKLRTTFLKRKKGLIKKVEELTILCDVIACVIIYGPVLGGRPREIFTWPVEQHRVRAAIKMYKEKMDHSRRTADLCNYLKDRKRTEAAEAAGGGCGNGFRVGIIRPEVAVAYLKWVDARIRAVEERIEFVTKSGGGQSVMLGDNVMAVMVSAPPDQSFQNLGYDDSVQEWMRPYSGFADQYDQNALCVYNNGLCTNGVSDHMMQFQPPEPTLTDIYQTQNQMVLYDPYMLGMDQVFLNGQLYHHQQPLYGEKMQFSDNMALANMMTSCKMDDIMPPQMRPGLDERSSPEDASSSNHSSSSSNQFNKAAAVDIPSYSFEDQLEHLFSTAEFCDEIQPHRDGGAAVPSCHYGF